MSTPRKFPWQWAWVVWLVTFLCVEVPAAITEGKRTRTLSKFVWRWYSFDGKRRFWVVRRTVFVLFWTYLGCHFVFMAPWWPLVVLGVGMAACIVYSIAANEGDLVGLDGIVKWVGLRWLGRKVSSLRKGGSVMMKLLDGNKRLILVLGFVITSLYSLATGDDVRPLVESVLKGIGWTDGDTIANASGVATLIAPLVWAIWASVSALWKMWKQHKAGASVTQLNSPEGIVKLAVAEGVVKSASLKPVVLNIMDKTRAVEPVVIATVEARPAA